MSKILFVVSDTTSIPTSDAALQAYLVARAHTLVPINDETAVPGDIATYDLVILAPSAVQTPTGIKYRDVAVPLLSFTLWRTANTAMTAATTSGVGSQTAIVISDATHPLAAGYPVGSLTVAPAGTSVGFIDAATDSFIDQVAAATNTRAVIFAIDAGVTMAGGVVAPAKRVGFGLTTFQNLNAAGLALFDAALNYCLPLRSRILTIPTDELTRTKDQTGTWVIRLYARRRGEVTWTNLSDVAGEEWVVDISTRGSTPDNPVTQFTVNFLRASDGRSLAPGMAGDPFNQVATVFKPFLHPDTEIYVDAANIVKGASVGTAVWRRWLEGIVQSVAWPGDYVTCACNSMDWVIEDTDIREEEVRGAPDPGTPMPTEIQGLTDRWKEDPVTLYVPVDPEAGVGEYKTAIGKLGAQNRALASKRIAWDVRYLWDTATQSFRYTLYEPPRDKTTPDLFLAPGQVNEVPGLEETGENIRNEFSLTATDATGRQFTRHRSTVYPVGSPSYRRRWMGLVLEDTMTLEQADALLYAADLDLSKPLAEMKLRLPFIPWLSMHDLIELAADSIRFDTTTQWAVITASHTASPTDKYTEVDVRGGGPVGQYYAWLARAAATMPDDLEGRSLYDVVEGEPLADGSLSPSWKRGPLVASVRGASRVYALPEKRADWDDLMSRLALLRQDTINIPPASQGYYSISHVEPRDVYLRVGRVWRKILIGTAPEVRIKTLLYPENAEGTEASMFLEMIDPRGVLTGINLYISNAGVEAGPFAATLTAPLTWEYSGITLYPDHPVFVRLESPRNDGQEPWAHGPDAVDTDKIPGIPVVSQVWTADSVSLRVDGLDTDTAALFYRPVIAGVAGAEVSILPRDGGTNPRYGAFTVTAGATELRYYIYGKNAAGEGGPLTGMPYKDERVAVYVAPEDTLYERTELRILPASNATQVVFEGHTVPAGGTVTLTAITGSATLVSGPAIGVSSPDGQQWTIGRGAFDSGIGQVAVLGHVVGYEDDTAFLSVEDQGRDTVPLQMKVEVLSPSATQVTGKVWVADPYPGGNVTVTYTYTGVASVSPGTPQTILGGTVTTSLTTTGNFSFTVVLGETPGRVLFTVSAANRLTQTDAIDVPARVGLDGIADVVRADVANEGATAHISTHHDLDTWSGTGAGRYRIDGGSPTLFDIDGGKNGAFDVTRSTTADILVEVAGSLLSGTWGPWFPRPVDRYDPPPPILPTLVSVHVSIDDTGANDVYTTTITGTALDGLDVDVSHYRSGVLKSTQTFSYLANPDTNILVWTDTGAGDGVSQNHYVIAQLYDAGTGANFGAPAPSRVVPSII